MLERLGHHRVGEHRQDRAAREGEDEGDGAVRDGVEEGEAHEGGQAERERDAEPEHENACARPARLDEPDARGDRLRDVRERDRHEEGGADAALDHDGEAEHERLGNSVEHGAEDDRERRALGLAPARVLTVAAAHPVDQEVARPERHRAREEAERDAAPSALAIPRLLHELEGDGADEHAAPERHHETERLLADPPAERDSPTDDQGRGGEKAPREGRRHERSFARYLTPRIARRG